MNIPDKFKTPYACARYIVINGIFAACIYFGFFVGIEGAANVAVFMAWLTGLAGLLMWVGITLDSLEHAKGELIDMLSRRDPSPVPFWFDATFDIIVVGAFIWSGYYWVTFFYIISIQAGKMLRDIPADIMLKKLKSQQS